ncbi:MAG: peptidoglycan binding domain-containing protein, partial [Lachnospiraceae bacterium]|nr:peptidoglycan binding domain-containing protein [Lachnospiraceae bacterium]
WKWVTALWTPASYEIDTMLLYDEAMLAERIRSLACMNPEQMIEPQDAYLTGYQSATASYEIIEAVEGTELLEEHVRSAVADAVMQLSEEVDLDAAGCYTKPAKYADDPELTALANELNRYVGAAVNHVFGNTKEVLNGDTIHKWLTIDGTTVTLDESQITKYVRALAKKYNTAYGSRKM